MYTYMWKDVADHDHFKAFIYRFGIEVNWLKLKQLSSQGTNMSEKLTLPLGLKL